MEELQPLLSDLSDGFSFVLAGGLALLLLGSVVLGPTSPLVHHPLPWQVKERAAQLAPEVERILLGKEKLD